MKEYKPSEPMTIVYDYLFNYFGEDKFNGRIITGAAIELAINVYDNNDNEIKFTSEPVIITEYGKKYLCDIYDVSFDRKEMFVINKNLYIDNLCRTVCGYNKIDFKINSYSLDYKESYESCMSYPFEVSEKDFKTFLLNHIDDFDISDNVHAQVPSYGFR